MEATFFLFLGAGMGKGFLKTGLGLIGLVVSSPPLMIEDSLLQRKGIEDIVDVDPLLATVLSMLPIEGAETTFMNLFGPLTGDAVISMEFICSRLIWSPLIRLLRIVAEGEAGM